MTPDKDGEEVFSIFLRSTLFRCGSEYAHRTLEIFRLEMEKSVLCFINVVNVTYLVTS